VSPGGLLAAGCESHIRLYLPCVRTDFPSAVQLALLAAELSLLAGLNAPYPADKTGEWQKFLIAFAARFRGGGFIAVVDKGTLFYNPSQVSRSVLSMSIWRYTDYLHLHSGSVDRASPLCCLASPFTGSCNVEVPVVRRG
jgi:hypothetical protein